jgi:hypothetical protein
MNTADAIREHVLRHHIQPARTTGNATVSVTAGQIHSEMKLKDRLPAICAAIGSLRFENAFRVKLNTYVRNSLRPKEICFGRAQPRRAWRQLKAVICILRYVGKCVNMPTYCKEALWLFQRQNS